MPPPPRSHLLEREWVTIRDPGDDHRLFTFDVSFLLSGYRCVYGQGCPGITPADRPDLGCCVHGAHLDTDEDPDELQRRVEQDLDPTTMQFHAAAVADGATGTHGEGEHHTRVVEGACVFLNRYDHPDGAGCALHAMAERRGEHPMAYKPTVCWQLPLHRTIDEQVANDGGLLEVHTVAAFERGHWGDGGAAFDWWCTEEAAAFPNHRPLYRDMEAELRAMVGDVVYEALADHLDRRRGQPDVVAFLPVL